MIKLVYCITKKVGLTDEEFFHYWEDIHGPLGARIPHLRRFVQSHRVMVPGDKRRPDYDGMVELWFDDREALIGRSSIVRMESLERGRSELHRPQQSCVLCLRGARHRGARRSKIKVIRVSRWLDRSDTRSLFQVQQLIDPTSAPSSGQNHHACHELEIAARETSACSLSFGVKANCSPALRRSE